MSAISPPLVAHVVHRLAIGGLENGVVNLVNHMPAARFRHAIVCLAGFDPAFRSRITRPDVQVVSLDKRPGKDLGAYARMWRALRRLRPDIVHTRNLGTIDMQWMAAAAGVRARVHGEHGWEASDPAGLDPRNLRIRRACRPVIRRYVPMSRDLAEWLRRDVCVRPDRIRQAYNGVDTSRFVPAPPPRAERRFPADWPASFRDEGVLVVGTVGRLDPVKNQVALLEAVAAGRTGHPEVGERVRLVIAGDGPLRAVLQARAVELGLRERVWLAGSRNDTPDILRSFDVFVLPSVNEGISNTILEAMATGLPVVAGRVGGNPELVVDGATGALYDPSVATGLQDALLPYLREAALREAHGRAGRKRAVSEFSLDAMVARYVDLYDELLSERTPGRVERASQGRA